MKVFKLSIACFVLAYSHSANALEHRYLSANATATTNTTKAANTATDDTPVAAPEDDDTSKTKAAASSTTDPSSTDTTGDDDNAAAPETEEEKEARLQKELDDLNEQTKKAFANNFDVSEDFNFDDIDQY